MLTRSHTVSNDNAPPSSPPSRRAPSLPSGETQASVALGHGETSLWRRLLTPRTLISFAVAAAILWFVVRRLDVDPAAILAQVRQANPLPLAVAFLLWYSAFFVRGWRWGRMIESAGAASASDQRVPPVPELARVILLAYFANSLVPAKLGDAYRTYLLKREGNVAYSAGFGTILAERIVDAMMLVVVLGGSAFLIFGRQMPSEARPALLLGGFVVAGGLVGLGLMWLTRDAIVRFLPERPRGIYARLQGAVFGALRRPAIVFGLGLLLWIGDGFRVWFVARSLDAGISPAVAIFMAVMAALLTIIPFTPAGLGVVELGVGSVLVGVLGVDPVIAGSIIVLDRVVTYWSLLLIGGGIYAWQARRDFQEEASLAATPPPS